MRARLVTFADNANRSARERLVAQALAIGVFDELVAVSEADLDREFLNRHPHRLVAGSRGFGYWRWKPQIILQCLRGMNDGDVLMYVDAGCHINAEGRQRLEQYIERVAANEHGFLGFQARLPEPPLIYDGRPLPEYLEAHWTKGDLLDRLDCRYKPWITQTPPIGAGVFLIRAQSVSVSMIVNWQSIMDEQPTLLDDTPSVSANLPGFREHRHDQSILSLLAKEAGVDTLSSFEYWYPMPGGRQADWEALRKFPVHARRDLQLRVSRPTPETLAERS